ncbi:MAG: hypothetical protein LWY06_14235, partial [Firmicutes bacterium]|nr:hypothetical protein [Bacillota bacterium]
MSILTSIIFVSLISMKIEYKGNYYLYFNDKATTFDFLTESMYHKRYELMKSNASQHKDDPSYFITIATYSVLMEKFNECRLFLEKAFDANKEDASYIFEIHNYFGSMLTDIFKTD